MSPPLDILGGDNIHYDTGRANARGRKMNSSKRSPRPVPCRTTRAIQRKSDPVIAGRTANTYPGTRAIRPGRVDAYALGILSTRAL